MKKNIYFFYCSFSVHYGLADPNSYPVRTFFELVEVGKDETAPIAFHKWIAEKQEASIVGMNPRHKPNPIITSAYVLAP